MDKSEAKLLRDNIDKLIEDFKGSVVNLGIADFSKEPELIRFLTELKEIKKLIKTDTNINDISNKIDNINIDTGNINILSLFGMYKKLLSQAIPKTTSPVEATKPIKAKKSKSPISPPNEKTSVGFNAPTSKNISEDTSNINLSPDILTKAVRDGMIDTNKLLGEQLGINKSNEKEQDRTKKPKKGKGMFDGIFGDLMLFSGVTKFLPMIIGGIGTLIFGLGAILVGTGAIDIDSILKQLGELRDAVMPQLKEMFKSFGEAFNSLIPVVLGLVKTSIPYIIEAIKYIGSAIVKATPWIMGVIKDSIPYIVGMFKYISDGISKLSTGDISGSGILVSIYALWKLFKFVVWVGVKTVKVFDDIFSLDYKSSIFVLPKLMKRFLLSFERISNMLFDMDVVMRSFIKSSKFNGILSKLKWIPEMFKSIGEFSSRMEKSFSLFRKENKNIISVLKTLGKIPIIGKMFKLIGNTLSFIGSIFGKIIAIPRYIGNAFKFMPKLLGALKFLGKWSAILTPIFMAIDFIKGWMSSDGTWLEKLKAGLTEVAMGFMGLPLEILGWIGDKILGIFGVEIEGGLGAKFIENARTMLDSYFGFFTNIYQELFDILKGIWDKTKSLIDAIIPDFLKGDPEKVEKKADKKARIASLTSTLEKDNVIDKNIFGKSEIKDWPVVEKMSHGEVQTLVDYNDWDKPTSEKLKKLLENKAPGDMKSAHEPAIDTIISDKPKVTETKATAGEMLGTAHRKTTKESLNRSVPEYYGTVPSSDELGALSAKYESKGKAGTVSSGKGDYGGVSYGTYQMASRGGKESTAGKYVKNSEYAQDFAGLLPGTKGFSDKWEEVAKRDGDKFGRSQHEYIKKTHFDPMANKLGKSGLDLSSRGKALQDVIWSTSVQLGGDSAIVERALKGKDPSKMSDEEIIKAVYTERGRRTESGDLAYFSKNSKDVQESVANRFVNEQKDALAMNSRGGTPSDISKSMGGLIAKAPTKTANYGVDGSANQRDYVSKADGVTRTDYSPTGTDAIPGAKPEYKLTGAEVVPRDYISKADNVTNTDNTYSHATQLGNNNTYSYATQLNADGTTKPGYGLIGAEAIPKDYAGRAEATTNTDNTYSYATQIMRPSGIAKSGYNLKGADVIPRDYASRADAATNTDNTYSYATQLMRPSEKRGFDLSKTDSTPRVDVNNIDRIQREINEKESSIEMSKIQTQEYQNKILNDSKTSMTKGFASIKDAKDATNTGDTYTSGPSMVQQNNIPTDIESIGIFLVNSGWV